MRLRTTIFRLGCLALSLLAGCTSDTEKQGFDAVEKFYGGHVSYLKGSHLSTDASEPQGKYLEVDLSGVALAPTYGTDLEVPAANCAYLVYQQLAPAERQSYDYLKIKLIEANISHTLSFPLPNVALAAQGVAHLNTIMAALQQRNYRAIVDRFDRATLGATSPDTLLAHMAHMASDLPPLTSYQLNGYVRVNGASATQPNLRYYLTVPGFNHPRTLWVTLNPRLQPTDEFLLGMHLFKQ